MQTKTCKHCRQNKPVTDFSENRIKKQFSAPRQAHAFYCKKCMASLAAKWRSRNAGYKPSGKITRIPLEDRLLMSAIRRRLNEARVRCKKLRRPLPAVDLTADYLYQLFKRQQGRCALSGVTLALTANHPHCLSLDKIDANQIYVEGNVQWLSWYINRAKGEMSVPVFYSMCETVLGYRDELEAARPSSLPVESDSY